MTCTDHELATLRARSKLVAEKAQVALCRSLLWEGTLTDGERLSILEAALRDITAVAKGLKENS